MIQVSFYPQILTIELQYKFIVQVGNTDSSDVRSYSFWYYVLALHFFTALELLKLVKRAFRTRGLLEKWEVGAICSL